MGLPSAETVEKVKQFTATHGYFDGWLADSILQLIPTASKPTE